MLELTKLESQVLKGFKNLVADELDMSEFSFDTVSDYTGVEVATLKGVIGSLVKKGLVETFAGDFSQMIRLI